MGLFLQRLGSSLAQDRMYKPNYLVQGLVSVSVAIGNEIREVFALCFESAST
jgi:hypothetical protein